MDTLLTLIVSFTQLFLGAMGIYVALRPRKEKNHRRWIGAFIIVGLFGVALTGWIALRASNAQDVANKQIAQAVTAATNANTVATNANNAVLDEQKEVKTARDDEKAAYDQLARLITSTSGKVTGGDALCYFDIPGEQIPLSLLSLRKRGHQPLYDVNAVLWIGHQGVALSQALRIGNIPEGDRPSFLDVRLDAFNLKDQKEVDFVVAFSAKNGWWHELMYARRKGEMGPGGKWIKAIRVYRIEFRSEPGAQNKRVLVFERIDEGFPLEGIEWIDWLQYAN